MNASYLIMQAAAAAALAMDAFSVSICIGLCHEKLSLRDALTLGGAFGFFQFFMPLAGGMAADRAGALLGRWAPWAAAALIIWIAVNMIREAGSGKEHDEKALMSVTFRNVVILAFATSLDALAAGFSVKITGGSALLLAVLAGIITFSLSFAGSLAGKKIGAGLGKKAEYLGGAALLAIAAEIIIKAIP